MSGPPGACAVECADGASCGEPILAKGLCRLHYHRVKAGWSDSRLGLPAGQHKLPRRAIVAGDIDAALASARGVIDDHHHLRRTRASYRRSWRRFESWCAGNTVSALPAAPETVAAYVGSLGNRDYMGKSAESELSAIIARHKAAEEPHAFPEAWAAVNGLKREAGDGRRQVPRGRTIAASADQVAALVASEPPAEPRGAVLVAGMHLVRDGLSASLEGLAGWRWEDGHLVQGNRRWAPTAADTFAALGEALSAVGPDLWRVRFREGGASTGETVIDRNLELSLDRQAARLRRQVGVDRLDLGRDAEFRRAVLACDVGRYLHTLDTALVLLGFYLPTVFDDWQTLRWRHLSRVDGGWDVRLERGAADPHPGRVTLRLAPRADPRACPVAALDRWHSLAAPFPERFVFPSIRRSTVEWTEPAGYGQLEGRLREWCIRAGLPILGLGSFELGFVEAALDAGAPEAAILLTCRRRSAYRLEQLVASRSQGAVARSVLEGG